MLSEEPTLNAFVHARFREVFGAPHGAEGNGEQWTLRGSDEVVPINIMVNGTPKGPAVWVFDPTDHVNGVLNTAIRDKSQVEPLINLIHQRMKLAVAAAERRRAQCSSGRLE